ncbi:unnamed protein product, partial [Symbiodinium necroappetens]
MAGEASTPEWSDVEQGNVPSEDESEEEPRDPMTFQLRNAPLWVLNLSPAEYLQWSTPGGIMDRAQNDFHEQRNPNSIVWPVWWTIAFDHLDTNADGVIQVTEDVVMLQCNLATVRCEDEVCRQVFVVWICEEETGQERMLAANRMWQRPVVYRHDGDGERCDKTQPVDSNFIMGAANLVLGGWRAEREGTHSGNTLVLADSGANELIRPAGDAAPSRSTKVSLTLADGNLTFAWKTRDGELAIPGDSSSWI